MKLRPQSFRESVRMFALVAAGASTSAVIGGVTSYDSGDAVAPLVLLAGALCAAAVLTVAGRALPATLVAAGALPPGLLWLYMMPGAA